MWPNIIKMINYYKIIPIGTYNVERGFNHMKFIKDLHSNQMS